MAQVQFRGRGIDRRPQVFNLSHIEFCERVGKCSCTDRVLRLITHNPEDGSKKRRNVPSRQCASLRVYWGKLSEPVDEAALEVPQIANAVRRRTLAVHRLRQGEGTT